MSESERERESRLMALIREKDKIHLPPVNQRARARCMYIYTRVRISNYAALYSRMHFSRPLVYSALRGFLFFFFSGDGGDRLY